MTEAKKRKFVRDMFKLAYQLGVEDIEPQEMVYAVSAFERGETAVQIAKHLWGKSHD